MHNENHECSDCISVLSVAAIYDALPQRFLKRISKKPRFVGKFSLPGWTGHANFYIFKCQACKGVALDYAHGYTNGGMLYLACKDCSFDEGFGNLKRTIHPIKDGNIYKMEESPFSEDRTLFVSASTTLWFFWPIILLLAAVLWYSVMPFCR